MLTVDCVKQKMDLGACPKAHTDRLKTEFEAAKVKEPNNSNFARFQAEYENNIFSFVDECDRRIKAAHRRLEKTPEENAKTTNLVRWCAGMPCGGDADFCSCGVQMREIGEIELAIQGGTEKIEQLGTTPLAAQCLLLTVECSTGEQGRVDDSMKELAAVEALKAEKSEKEVGVQLLHRARRLLTPV